MERIQTTFLQILEEKPFESITIGDITKAAGVNRGTFYLHYLDKYDLLEQMEQRLFADLGKHIDELQSRYLSEPTFEAEQERLAEALFGFIEGHVPMLSVMLGDHGRAGFTGRFKAAFSGQVRSNLERNESFRARLNIPLAYFLSFITSAFLGLIEQWIQHDLDKTPREMTDLYMEIIRFIQKKE